MVASEPPRAIQHALRRHSFWYALFLVMLGVVAWIAPAQLPIVAYKVMLVALAPIGAFWVDRFLFDRLGPMVPGMQQMGSRIIARAVVYAATIIALALAL